MTACVAQVNTRRKLFWVTQPDACGSSQDNCGTQCGQAGFSTTNTTAGNTFATNDWLRGLIINMLMTDGREPDTECGYRPGSQGGHWSESYIESGDATIGTLVRTVKSTGTLAESVSLMEAYAQATLERLVSRGVASSVETTATYIGNLRVQLDVIVYGRNGENDARVGLSATRLENGWVWQ